MSTLENVLLQHRRRIQDPESAFRVWTEFLSDAERRRLGSLEDQYQDNKTVGIWVRAKGVDEDLATAQLAYEFGLPTPEYHRLLERLNEPIPVATTLASTPSWNRGRGELWYQGGIVRSIPNVLAAPHITLILDAFEEDSWAERIDDPLPSGPNPERLRDAVRSLNRDLTLLRFRTDGTGRGLRWEPDESHRRQRR